MRIAVGSNATFLVEVPTMLQETYYPQPPTTARCPLATIPSANCPPLTITHCPLPTLPTTPKTILKKSAVGTFTLFQN